jgi:hypothetical protein
MKKKVSRKGAKAQRKARKHQAALKLLAFFLCVFAPLREKFLLTCVPFPRLSV